MPTPEQKTKGAAIDDWRSALNDERLTHLIKTAFRCTSGSLSRRLKQYDVLYGHWTLLRVLWRGDGLTQRQLSEQAGVTEPSTITALKAMEAQGYVTRRKVPGNNKNIRVFLTPKGAALRSAIVGCAEEVHELAIQGVAKEDLAATRRTLLAVIDNLARDAALQEGDGA
ncbi:MarR family transcriptional regulator [Pigmentiphaga sp.]|jgi:Transcriptional regulators|uniref:MarR family winged helix-turn-helix transcriptional regulator n=1 Tax=Pigmentiphaga sp. TaxID=1977564 RepID=UPI0025DB3878|nr:MarR family transcriptional regulator [Pigmentiphaga sp.]MBX6320165.1 MarR family transcriptional regulator [Pigmentiphaga sp.]